ncbi:ABA4-like family protein [Candidatus Poseidoniaceae archaeon]|nr:ABA4-like family protein [Candidatus Poseidoniaceae archaeon]
MNDLAVVTFWFSSLFIGPMWIMMWFFPQHDITKKIVGDLRICVMPLIASYGILLVPNFIDVMISLGTQMPTPDIVLELFSTDEMIMLAWLHFLVMDTFAGRYIWMRMLAAERPIQISMPVLLFCMMAGPIGLLIGILATSDVKDDISVPSGTLE